MKDLYYILGTDRDCTTSELNAAYQKLARKLQPDERCPDHFLEDHFKEITEAYQILSDPDQRRKYDAAYKKNYQRRLYYFKIKHLNVAATLALLLFTGLFGWYVMKILNGSDRQKKVTAVTPTVQTPPATAPSPVVHHRKKHKTKVEAPVINQPTLLAKDTVIHHTIKPAPVIVSKSVMVKRDTIQGQPSTYSTYLQANATGVIYLHELPNYTSTVLSKIPDHSRVTVLEKDRQFYKVVFEGQTGYVPKWTVTNP